MNALRRDPSLQELFDRIIHLENQMVRLREDVIAPLQAENAVLRRDLNGLWEALKTEAESTSQHLGTIQEALWPVVYKVFPGIAKGHREVFAFLDKYDPDKKDDKGKPE
jgi:hypothetical protein